MRLGRAPPPSPPPFLKLDGDPRVLAVGAGLVLCTAVAATPPGQQLVEKLKLGGWKSASVLALLLNIAAVGIGGRFDGDPAVLQAPPWPTLLNPAGWAFAIWGAIYSGEIAAAGLDVFEEEPRIHPGLVDLPNVVMAPHLGSATVATRRKMGHMVADDLVRGLRGETLENAVRRS